MHGTTVKTTDVVLPAKEVEKTKYTFVSNEQNAGKYCNIRMENKSFEKVAEFK